MEIYITKMDKPHYNLSASRYTYRYLLNWYNPETGALMGDRFPTLKEILDYTATWPDRKIVKVNF